MKNKTCSCADDAVKTVFACSGAADLGEISDLVARKLHRDGFRQMKCLHLIENRYALVVKKFQDTRDDP